jgi:hypothetical protein
MVQSNTAGNPLSAGSLSTFMAASLPKDSNGLRNPCEAVALAVHAGMIAVGFRLVGLGEDHKIGKFQALILIYCALALWHSSGICDFNAPLCMSNTSGQRPASIFFLVCGYICILIPNHSEAVSTDGW